MARTGRGGFSPQNMIMVAIFAIVGIYLFSEFTNAYPYTCTQEDVTDELYGCERLGINAEVTRREFQIPENLDLPILTMIKLIAVGLALYVAYAIIAKSSGKSMSRRDIASLVITGIVVYLVWVYILEPMWGVDLLENISWTTAMKLGLI